MQRLGFDFGFDLETLPIEKFDSADLVLASRDLDGSFPWLDPAEPVKLLHLIRVAHRVSRDVSDVAARLAALGYGLPPGCEGLSTDAEDLVLLSRDLDSAAPWLDPAESVTPIHLLRCAKQTQRPVAAIADRLTLLGFPMGVDPAAIADVEVTPEDIALASRDLEGSPPWLDAAKPVSTLHLLRAAEAKSLPVAQIGTRLKELGYRLATEPDEIIVDHLDPDDTVITSVDLDGAHPWLEPTEPVPAVHLLRASRVTGRDVHDITARLTVFGYTVRTELGELTVDQLTRDDLVITSQDLDGADPWLKQDEPVGLPHLLQAGRRIRKPASEVAARLRQLGYAVDVDLSTIAVDKIRSNDLTYASNDLDGSRPWLDRDRPVALSHLLAAANKAHQPVSEVANRLSLMGYSTPDLDVRLPRSLPGGV
jgi:hypothetical protein